MHSFTSLKQLEPMMLHAASVRQEHYIMARASSQRREKGQNK
jgi:hypothetical protein